MTDGKRTDRVRIGGLRVARVLEELMRTEVLPPLEIDPQSFWTDFEALLAQLAP